MRSGQAFRPTGLLISRGDRRQLFTSPEDVREGTKWDVGAVSERLVRQALRGKVFGMLLQSHGPLIELRVILKEPLPSLYGVERTKVTGASGRDRQPLAPDKFQASVSGDAAVY
jgi:hypothetical protein